MGTKIHYQGSEFESFSDLAIHLGVSVGVLRRRIDKGLPEEEWGKPKKSADERNATALVYKGENFSSFKRLAEYLGINAATLKDRIKNGWPEDLSLIHI